MAGAVLALALIGALSAGIASGVERVRRKKPPRASDLSTPTEEVPHWSAQASRASAHPVPLRSHPELPRHTPSHDTRNTGAVFMAGTGGTVPSSALGGLAQGPGEAAPDTDPNRTGGVVTTARVPAPLHVSWRVVDSSGVSVRLVARLERSPGFTAPVEVSLRVPSRMVLHDGPTSPIVLEGDVQEVPWTVGLPEGVSPEEDLVLLASAEGEAFGVHAEARYRFGRALAEGPRPTPTGPPLPVDFMRARE
ncbi:hypothetical protein [Corallococcus terminator]|uniref:Uncharacterized protein n=1 Tax=Corallococcus terminator TaxID=2316733 RepID=A0A3A8J732_9BACT|nr:hypothetical protein [Corallococcus terminator]RKG91597.1 hypothetical protein D7V88_09135 [Corallococcus terminator]